MSVETHQLVDGQYVPRRISIQDIIHGRSSEPSQQEAPRPPRTPELGLLTRTVVRSPAIKWIFAARIRSPKLNDLVFVGEDYIQIVNVQQDGHFNYVGIKTDFGSKIRSAGVLGQRYGDEDLDEDTYAKLMKGTSPSPPSSPWTVPSGAVPPQILVLCLASGELRFIFSSANTDHGRLRYFESSLALPRQTSTFEEPGKLLTVDPLSRALAVAAENGTVLLYRLKDHDQITLDFDQDAENWTPIAEDVAIPVNATLSRMQFLYPSSKSDGKGNRVYDNQVILLVLGSRLPKTISIFCYEWDGSSPLRSFRTAVDGHQLDPSTNPFQRRSVLGVWLIFFPKIVPIQTS
jgi:Mono-functional DNA-alkylating methyl methanesulfonate N-term